MIGAVIEAVVTISVVVVIDVVVSIVGFALRLSECF